MLTQFEVAKANHAVTVQRQLALSGHRIRTRIFARQKHCIGRQPAFRSVHKLLTDQGQEGQFAVLQSLPTS